MLSGSVSIVTNLVKSGVVEPGAFFACGETLASLQDLIFVESLQDVIQL